MSASQMDGRARRQSEIRILGQAPSAHDRFGGQAMRVLLLLSRSILATVSTLLICIGLHLGPAQAESAAQQPRTAAQLEQLVAPIALYPDAVLSQILMASTYPLEVVEAARWSQANSGVSGQALEEAMQKQPWDPSVKALTAIPQTLQMMNDKLDRTRQLGDAFLAQQADVLKAVQQLRARADANGNLKTNEYQKVTKEAAPPPSAAPPRQGGQQTRAPSSSAAAPSYVYTVESTSPDQYYLPIYDPGIVYGAWPYPDYAPYSWYPSGYYAGTALTFAAGVAAGAAIWGGVNWLQNRVSVNPLRYNQFNRANITNTNWSHNAAHRGGVPYADRNVAQRFGDAGKAASREAFRGKADAGRRDLAKQGGAGKAAQGKAGQKGGAAAKAGAGAKQAANKAGGGSKQAASKTSAKSAGSKQARAKQGGGQARSKQAARPQQTRSQQAARAHQGQARHRPSGASQRTASQRSMAQHRPSMGHRGGGGRGGGGGRRSDIALKHDIILLGHLPNGLGFYRFAYKDSDKVYVGVMAQEVQAIMPAAVVRGSDGYLRVHYDKLGLTLQTYDQWIASGARIPVPEAMHESDL